MSVGDWDSELTAWRRRVRGCLLGDTDTVAAMAGSLASAASAMVHSLSNYFFTGWSCVSISLEWLTLSRTDPCVA